MQLNGMRISARKCYGAVSSNTYPVISSEFRSANSRRNCGLVSDIDADS